MKRLSLLLISLLLGVSCFACTGCATIRNLFDRDGGVHVWHEQVSLSLFSGDGSSSTRYSCRFTGELVENLPEGEGKLVCKDHKWTYEGGFERGHFSGQGRLEWDDGTVEEGLFDRDLLVDGTCTYPDGSSYQGTLVNGAYEGQGIFLFPDGGSYVGSFLAGQFSGEGVYTYSNGDTYEGSWSEGLFSGAGKYITADGTVYEGTFEDGVFIG